MRALLSRRQSEAHALLATDGPTHIKLCGMSREQDIRACNLVRPDLVGFIVDFPKSHRSVSPERAGKLAVRLDEGIYPVGVFVDADPGLVVRMASDDTISLAQLHGHEDEAYIAELRTHTDVGIIQAFRVQSAADVGRAQRSSADLVLLDAGQGSGKTFDWALLTGIKRPYLLAGGLGPDNVAQAIAALSPWGVDMSSGVESDRLKDADKMAAAVAAVRNVSG